MRLVAEPLTSAAASSPAPRGKELPRNQEEPTLGSQWTAPIGQRQAAAQVPLGDASQNHTVPIPAHWQTTAGYATGEAWARRESWSKAAPDRHPGSGKHGPQNTKGSKGGGKNRKQSGRSGKGPRNNPLRKRNRGASGRGASAGR